MTEFRIQSYYRNWVSNKGWECLRRGGPSVWVGVGAEILEGGWGNRWCMR